MTEKRFEIARYDGHVDVVVTVPDGENIFIPLADIQNEVIRLFSWEGEERMKLTRKIERLERSTEKNEAPDIDKIAEEVQKRIVHGIRINSGARV